MSSTGELRKQWPHLINLLPDSKVKEALNGFDQKLATLLTAAESCAQTLGLPLPQSAPGTIMNTMLANLFTDTRSTREQPVQEAVVIFRVRRIIHDQVWIYESLLEWATAAQFGGSHKEFNRFIEELEELDDLLILIGEQESYAKASVAPVS